MIDLTEEGEGEGRWAAEAEDHAFFEAWDDDRDANDGVPGGPPAPGGGQGAQPPPARRGLADAKAFFAEKKRRQQQEDARQGLGARGADQLRLGKRARTGTVADAEQRRRLPMYPKRKDPPRTTVPAGAAGRLKARVVSLRAGKPAAAAARPALAGRPAAPAAAAGPPAGAASAREKRQEKDRGMAILQQKVLGGNLWHPTCQALADRRLEAAREAKRSLPLEFRNVGHYVRTFAPLLMEEAREGVRKAFEEGCQGGRVSEVRVVRHMAVSKESWTEVDFEAASGNPLPGGRDAFVEGGVHVLCTMRPPRTDAYRWAQRKLREAQETREEGEVGGHAAFMAVVVVKGQDRGVVRSRGHPGCTRTDLCGGVCTGGCVKALKGCRRWFLVDCGNMVSAFRALLGLHNVKNSPLLQPLLQPERYGRRASLAGPKPVPVECSPEFMQHLKATLNPQQEQAVISAAHHAGSVANSSRHKGGRFTLIEGPPGTGKTHTILALLNVLHVIHFQRYYHALLQKLAPRQMMGRAEIGALETRQHKPRLLVCAPSNAAVDEILNRVMRDGFKDARCQNYNPNICRIGAGEAVVHEGVREVLVQNQAKKFLTMSQGEWQAAIQRCESEKSQLENEMMIMKETLDRSGVLEPRETQSTELGRLSMLHNDLEGKKLTHERLMMVRERFDQHSGRKNFNRQKLRRKLEMSYVKEAEIVFTTLGSSTKFIMSDQGLTFDVVLVDEAAQANEVETLQPLNYGAKHCILVGDPNQLPATILSKLAAGLEYERSLYERLSSAGIPSVQLKEQYRMDPAIRAFPSRYFYDNSLVDGANVVARPPSPFSSRLWGPYRVFNVTGGREAQGRGHSFNNVAEGEAVVRAVSAVASLCAKDRLRAPSLGIITPYKAQKECILKQLQRAKLVAPDQSATPWIHVDTVDAFQGQEKDIVIYSCVRTSASKFVEDARRINVAITRAKACLWIVGNLAGLSKKSEIFSDLYQDAVRRRCMEEGPPRVETTEFANPGRNPPARTVDPSLLNRPNFSGRSAAGPPAGARGPEGLAEPVQPFRPVFGGRNTAPRTLR